MASIMSTSIKLGKKLRQQIEGPTVLAGIVGAAVPGLSEKNLLEMTVKYLNCEENDNLSSMTLLLLRALREIHIQGEPTAAQIQTIENATKELRRNQPKFRNAMVWLRSPIKDTT